MPRRVVTPENLSPDFLIDLEKEAGPVGLNLSPDHFERDVLTGVISVKGYVDPGDTVSGGTAIADEGVLVVEAPSAINFTGTGVTATDVEGVATVAIPGTAVSDEGVVVAAAPTGINFTGQGVTVAANIDGSVTVDVTGVEGGHTVTDEGVHVLMSTDLIPVPLPPLNMDFVGFTLVDNLDQTITISYEKIGTGPIVMARRPIIQRIVSTGVTAVTEGFAVHMDSAVDLSVTVPANAAELIPIGAEYEIVRLGTGAVTVQGAAGVTINGVVAGANEITIQYGSAVLRKIAADVWLLMGAIESAEPIPEVELPVYLWADVFTDHSATLVYSDNDPGADWTGWGESSASPAEVPLEWFMQNVLANEAPNGAIIDLTSPTGQIHLQGRMQPPSSRAARNFTLDLSGNRIERAQGDDYWGQFFIWGEKVTDSALDSEGIIGADAALGTKVLTLRYPHIATDPLLTAAAPGSIIEIRTNTTRKGYHPDESRTTCFVESVNFAAKTITVVDPLEIAVPENNPVGSWETSDPSTVVLLRGSLLSANSPAGASTIDMASALGLLPGDWLVVGTNEKLGPDEGQYMDGAANALQEGDELDKATVPADFGDNKININEELHQIASISGNTVTLTSPLGKNKLMEWQAFAFKVDPIDNMTIIGGDFVGAEAHGGASAWDHQYIWCRYLVNSTIRDGTFDMDASKATNMRRTGQAVRLDTGDNTVMDNLTIGRPGSITAGEGYGVSMRKGERNSVIRNSYIEGARHSIEFWSTAGGCVAEDNHCADDTSSSIDTHGNWNTGITIQRNLITRDRNSAAVSPDMDPSEATDAIRIGNNKFILDRDIRVLNNRVIGYDGNALSLVPGIQDVIVDGLEIDGVWRIMNLKRNSRHTDLALKDVIVRNVDAKNIKDRWLDIRHVSHNAGVDDRRVAEGLLLQNWTIGADGPTSMPNDGNPIPGQTAISGMYFLHVDGLTLENWTITGANLTNDNWLMVFDEINNVTLTNLTIDVLPAASGGEADKALNFNNATNVRGGITITGLNPRASDGAPPFLLYFDDGTGYPSTTDGSFVITHDLGSSPKIIPEIPVGFGVTFVDIS